MGEIESGHQFLGIEWVVMERGVETQHLLHTDPGLDPTALQHDPHPTHQLAVVGHRIQSENPDRSSIGAAVPLDDLDGGGLARPVRAEHDGDPSLLGGETETIDRTNGAVVDDEIVHLHRRCIHRRHHETTLSGRRLRFSTVIDLRRLRTDFDGVRVALARRGVDRTELDAVRDLDERLRAVTGERDGLRAEINGLSKEVGRLRREGDVAGAEQLQERSREAGAREHELAGIVDDLNRQMRELLLVIPNLPSADAPDGLRPEENVEIRRIGAGDDPAAWADHQRVPHWDIGEELGILDLSRAVRMSGAMFTMFRRGGATLARALCQLALDRNSDLFEEIRPPTLVLTETMVSTGHLPKFSDDAYQLERDGLWAIPTAEVPLTSIARDEILDERDLPMRLMAQTACFRREAGSAGRDTRGLLRVHEFDKVEILAYATAAQADALHGELLARAEATIDALGLTYRVLDLCAGDLGNSSARTFDIEVYAPGVDQWLEVSSVSWFSDYQARRANIRYRHRDGKGTETVHTLNGSALAVPRVWAALVETHRRPDGSIALPEVLWPYFRGAREIR